MWGDFMEKAKSMAANIDQQITESVGIDENGEVQAQEPKQDDNAWNDDFDFDDVDDSPAPVAESAPAKESELEAIPPPKLVLDPQPQEGPTQVIGKLSAIETTFQIASQEGQDSVQAATKSDNASQPSVESANDPEPVKITPPHDSDTTAEGCEGNIETDAFDTSEMFDDRLDQEEEGDGLRMDSMEGNEEAQQQPESLPVARIGAEVEEVEENALTEDDMMVKTEPEKGKDKVPELNGKKSEPVTRTEESGAEIGEDMEVRESFANQTQPESEKDATDEAPKSSSGFSGMLPPAVGSLSFGSPRANMLSPSSNSAKGKEETPRSTNVTSLFSSIASAVDSALDSAVDKAPSAPAVDVVSEEHDAWDDEDFDFPDDQSLPKETTVPQVYPGKEVEVAGMSGSAKQATGFPVETSIEPGEKKSALPPLADMSSELQPSSVVDKSVAEDIPSDSHSPAEGNIENDPRYKRLQHELRQREEQLTSKSVQLTQLQSLWESQERELRQKIQDTKEEAKTRIQRAKERCETAEARLKQNAAQGGQSSAEKEQLINDLRSEGEVLMRKQSQMEQAVRNANGETRQLRSKLAEETAMKQKAMGKVEKLESELKETKESLKSAQKGESQAGKLENDLLAARSESEMKASTILSLQQKVKELAAEGKELKKEMEKSKKTAVQDAQQERKNLRREHNDVISDLETKLRTTEREAGVREDALRHEVTELRKRWQDAVRRADALSMDVQSSTAPLLRQLESMERQNRARAAGWTELENRLRSELEETVIQNETLSRERSEFKTKYTRLERSANESETELKELRRTIEDQTAKIDKLESQVETLASEAEKREEEYQKVERLANEGVMRVRSEMTQTVVDSEERYRGQIEKLESDLRLEKERRDQLQNQVEDLLENTGIPMPIPVAQTPNSESKPKKLRQAEGQAQILAGALGFAGDSDDETDDGILGGGMDRGGGSGSGGVGSFAALEQLTSRLKAAQVELESLRSNLRESERSRESLVKDLAESQNAKEKLPLFEAKVKTLTEENREMELEIRGLRDDIADVRELYRSQLNILLEEKTSHLQPGNEAFITPIDEAGEDDESEAIASA
ncbi:unnamed protein product [Cylindrotheca closterium]|uniref:TATA element modulatory factor 1 TATA binding domain-containing protein n=1 Tax=Cylindrotheca closterium TaxID=2856 RepID=A0AAD2FJL4_9STRA|nr:unnamed protein product [Cylindrotheca closterium]